MGTELLPDGLNFLSRSWKGGRTLGDGAGRRWGEKGGEQRGPMSFAGAAGATLAGDLAAPMITFRRSQGPPLSSQFPPRFPWAQSC